MAEENVDYSIAFEYKHNCFVKQGCGIGLKATRGYHCDFKCNGIDYIYDFDTLTNKATISKKGNKTLFDISERKETELEDDKYEELKEKVEKKIKNRICEKANPNTIGEYNKANNKGMSEILKFGFKLQQTNKQLSK